MKNNKSPKIIMAGTSSLRAIGHTRTNFSIYHLNSAQMFIKFAAEIESAYTETNKITELDKTNYISYLSSSIIASVSSLESNINELFSDLLIKSKHEFSRKSVNTLNHAMKLFTGKDIIDTIKFKQKPVLEKYKIFSKLIEKEYKSSQEISINFKYITSMRNALIHFTPDWTYETSKHSEIEDIYISNYEKIIKTSPFYNSKTEFFPRRCLSVSCAKWTLLKTQEFTEIYDSCIQI